MKRYRTACRAKVSLAQDAERLGVSSHEVADMFGIALASVGGKCSGPFDAEDVAAARVAIEAIRALVEAPRGNVALEREWHNSRHTSRTPREKSNNLPMA